MAGASVTESARVLGVSRGTVSKVMTAFEREGKMSAAKHRSGRKSKLTERGRQTLKRIVREDRKTTAPKITAELNEDLHNTVSTKTVCRELHKSGFHGRAAIRKPLLSMTNVSKHLEWCSGVNLSSHVLTTDELSVLSRGLNFVPVNRFNCFEWVKDLNLFCRKLKWKKFFRHNSREACKQQGLNEEDIEGYEALIGLLNENDRVPTAGKGPFTTLRNKSERMPPVGDMGNIDIFASLVERDLKKLAGPEWENKDNLLASERIALEALKKNDQIVVKPSDKGGNMVILNHIEYREMCYAILQDNSTYEVLKENPMASYKEELQLILSGALAEGVISKTEFDFILPKFPLVATFYALPKIHKGLNPLKGRPIVSGVDSLTQNSGLYIDQILRPFVVCMPSYLRDTSDLLLKLEGVHLEGNAWLASIDIEALYSNIPHDVGIKGVGHFLSQRSIACRGHNSFLTSLLQYILTHNAFCFDGKFYHQLRGTAMGCPCAPSYANLFLGWWEETIVFGGEEKWWHCLISLWYRFIDDVFMVWTGDKDQFEEFVRELNRNSVNLRFTSEIQKTEIPFLDIKIQKDRMGGISTSIFRKPTSTNSLLHWQSHHPVPLKRGIPKGQFLRLRRNCSRNDLFQRQAGDMFCRFKNKGYPQHVLDTAYDFARKADRAKLLQKREIKDSTELIRVIGTFDVNHQEVRKVLSKHWDVLRLDPDLKNIIGERPNITFRKGRSIRDMLVHSQYRRPLAGGTWLDRRPCGFFKCGDCSFCNYMRPGKSFCSASTGRMFFYRGFSNCKTTGVIYMATCSCPKNYIGKTRREFRRRVGEHLGDIRHKRETPLAKHMWMYHNGDLGDIKFCAVEVVHVNPRGGNVDKVMLRRECEWIFRMESLEPRGLNEQLSYACFL
ncbi:uncharacterized protein [Dendrobates tinctorius]|uniref:uncharacterized protein n=1 Tax=Dendrobates tinctorius TaxID=92724 RepID=UPI003CCA481C